MCSWLVHVSMVGVRSDSVEQTSHFPSQIIFLFSSPPFLFETLKNKCRFTVLQSIDPVWRLFVFMCVWTVDADVLWPHFLSLIQIENAMPFDASLFHLEFSSKLIFCHIFIYCPHFVWCANCERRQRSNEQFYVLPGRLSGLWCHMLLLPFELFSIFAPFLQRLMDGREKLLQFMTFKGNNNATN